MTTSTTTANSVASLLNAIVDDDRVMVRNLLKNERALATRLVEAPRLFESSILHWIYVGDTALHLAAAGYRVEIANLLIRAGADPNAAFNHRRGAPLHYAVDGYSSGSAWNPKRQTKMIRCLLEAGARIDAQDKNGATPLHRAVRTRCAEAVQCLLDAGCDPELRNESGSTPFHLAVQNTGRGGSGTEDAKTAQRQIIAAFLQLGLSTALKDGRGKTVMECAKSAPVRELLS